MKNLFKNLMLVAVAAMAFTSCSQDVNELNKLEKKTTFEFVASFDGDTRSGFTGSSEDENGTVMYHSEWFGGETVMLVAGDQVVPATVDAEGKFSATFEGEVSQIDIYTPMDSFYKPYVDYNFYQVNPEVLAEQTPLTNSVDPKAHVAKGYVMVDAEGNQIIPVSLTHDVAYGKMTVNAPAEFVIDHVVVNLVGSYNNFTYTINADNVENNTFWFATEPLEVAEFTVTAYDAEGTAVTKSVDVAAAGKTLAFNYGRVSTFSVSGLEEVEAPAAPAFTSATWTNNWAPADKLIEFHSEELGTLQLNFYNCNSDSWLDARTYGFANSGDIYYGGTYSWYKNETAGIDAEICNGTVIVAVVDGQYYIEFKNLVDWDGNVYIEYATFKGEISGLQLPDTREKLATPSATATVEGKTIKISWNAVDNVNGYRVKLYSPYDEYFEKVVTGTEYVYEAQQWGTTYSFTIMSYASDDNITYKSSDDAYVYATIGANPDYTYEWATAKAKWYGSANFTIEALSTDERSKFYFDMYCPEASDKLLPEGTYTYGYQSSTHYIGYGGVAIDVANPNNQVTVTNSGTVTVEHIEGGYKFTINVNGMNSVYEGRVEDIDGSGVINPGDGTTDPEPELPAVKDQYNVTWNYELDCSGSGVFGHLWTVTSGDGGFYAQIGTDSRNNYTTSTSFTLGEYAYHTLYADGNNGSGMYFTMTNIKIEGVGYSNYSIDGEMVVTLDNGVYAITIDLYNKINGYTTDKITTLVGTFGSADSGSGDSGETTDPENPGEGETTVPEGYIELNQCIYYGDLYGAGLADEFVLLSADGKNKLFFNINNATTDSNYIPTGEYTIASVGSPGYTFNMSTISDTTYINGQAYGNGVADNSSSTMSVVSEGKGGIHEIKLTINNNQGTNKFYFKGTIN